MTNQAKRWTVGRRGGDRRLMPTECSTCVAYRSCRPGACSEPFGCESWVDDAGRRALPYVIEERRGTDPGPLFAKRDHERA